MGRIVDIFKRHGPLYLRIHGANILPSHRRTIYDICRCRTPIMGGHVYRCSQCNHYRYSYHCCGNRHCPQCRSQATRHWVQQRKQELMPVPYFHLVFTLPSEYRDLVRTNQKAAFPVLFKAAAAALVQLAADERYVGAQIGILAVLHTWSRAMIYHPHVHLLVPGVGLGPDGDTVHFSRRKYLVPVKALSILFQIKFTAMLKKALPDKAMPRTLKTKAWVVFCKPLDLGPDKVIDYLGRYLNRVAICDDRLHRLSGGDVLVKYWQAGRMIKARLSPHEFLRRYLQHVLPKGLNKVRRYGLYAPARKKLLQQLRCRLLLAERTPKTLSAALPQDEDRPAWPRCPHCGSKVMKHAFSMPPDYCSRSPPMYCILFTR